MKHLLKSPYRNRFSYRLVIIFRQVTSEAFLFLFQCANSSSSVLEYYYLFVLLKCPNAPVRIGPQYARHYTNTQKDYPRFYKLTSVCIICHLVRTKALLLQDLKFVGLLMCSKVNTYRHFCRLRPLDSNFYVTTKNIFDMSFSLIIRQILIFIRYSNLRRERRRLPCPPSKHVATISSGLPTNKSCTVSTIKVL